jgi:hypothetical protein
MYKVVTHPENVEYLRNTVRNSREIHPMFVFKGIEITQSPYLPKDVLSGKYIQPDGRIVAKADILIKTRWIEYGPEDFDWLMFARIIKEHRERYYLVIDDSKLRQIHSQPLTMKLRSQF